MKHGTWVRLWSQRHGHLKQVLDHAGNKPGGHAELGEYGSRGRRRCHREDFSAGCPSQSAAAHMCIGDPPDRTRVKVGIDEDRAR